VRNTIETPKIPCKISVVRIVGIDCVVVQIAVNSYSESQSLLQSKRPHQYRAHPASPSTAQLSANNLRMHAVAFNALRTSQRPCSRRICRLVSGRRRALAYRNFHRSTLLCQKPDEPKPTESRKDGAGSEKTPEVPQEPPVEEPEREAEQDKDEHEDEREHEPVENLDVQISGENMAQILAGRKGRISKGSMGRLARFQRNKQPEGLPPVAIPDWFFTKNVKLHGDLDAAKTLSVFAEGAADMEDEKDMLEVSRRAGLVASIDLPPTKDAKYSIDVDVYQEILATFKAGLSLRPPRTGKNISRPYTVLECPKDGGSYYLDAVVQTITSKLGADLITLDAQDIGLIVGPYIDENLAWGVQASMTSLLGYDAQRAAGKLEDYSEDSVPGQDEGPEEEDDISILSRIMSRNTSTSKVQRRRGSKSQGRRTEHTGLHVPGYSSGSPAPHRLALFGMLGGPNSNTESSQSQKGASDHWSELKVSAVLEALIGAADSKRSLASKSNSSDPAGDVEATKDTIIQLKDYMELSSTSQGPDLLESLQTAVNKRWQDGRNILLVGTTANEDCGLSKSEIRTLESDISEGDKRTIFVPPDRRDEQDIAFESDEKARIRQINIRHIEDMIKKLIEGTSSLSLAIDIEKDLDTAASYSAGLGETVWKFSRVHRLATTIVGMPSSSNTIDGPVFAEAMKLLSASDEAKFKWGAAELNEETEDDAPILDTSNILTKEKLKKLKKTCNQHERKLLAGVKIPSDLHTAFGDVHAPKETIEALKTLTSLSLVRPEAFSYGVLENNKIPGLLLYGPPGTGKTMLAKAVAKDSGATVLEVSGAEINDMFVGEGEKNVRAIFSLAKKLSPCVVFIDEADAILAQRGTNPMKSTHREIINQFLREWDGMTDLSAFIMVATNRPFDLDEAVLRRLPRRLLVDLPVEKDRESILKIHLRGETLDHSVSLAKLAKFTPFYSGSDLKNLSVAAAMACIREENDMATKHTGEEPYIYPEKRLLTKAHFDKALDEISASISDDMSSLAAIRKFDEKYGDRKGRRKKKPSLGFGGGSALEEDQSLGRVRKVGI
jgi:SpoVK/Ycf46/Vps4 family AAA+-type ATPase